MNYYVKIVNLIAVLLIIALCSFPVNAATLSIENTYYGYADKSYYDTDPVSGISVTYNGNGINSFAGLLKVNYEGFDTWAFCVDLGTPLILGTTAGGSTSFNYTNSSSPVDYADNLVYVGYLLDQYAEETYDQGNPYGTDGAALQLAIWEVLYDTDLSVGSNYNLNYSGETSGSFFYNSAAIAEIDTAVNTYYNTYIGALVTAIDNNSFESSGNYVVVELDGAQDIIVNVVPEPTTALLFGFGLLGLCAAGRKRA